LTFVEFNSRLSNIQTSLIQHSARHNFRIVPDSTWFSKLGWRVHLKMTALDAFGYKNNEKQAKDKTFAQIIVLPVETT